MKLRFATLATAFAMATQVFAFGEDVFKPTVVFENDAVAVTFTMNQPDMHIYDDMLSCTLGEPTSKPLDAHLDADGRVTYEGLATFTYPAKAGTTFTMSYQGCDADMCHMPQDTLFTILPDGTVVEGEVEGLTPAAPTVAPTAEAVVAPPVQPEAPQFPAASRQIVGEAKPDAFLAFLKGETSPEVTFLSDPVAYVNEKGIWIVLLFIFVGGFFLNLTPCVLPMIPINLAIIGAGAAGGSRLQGATRGGAYGLGIALAYGILGLIPVLTGAAFGTIQSTWWFNGAIAVIFVLLALALFDVFMIDFTRFSQGGNSKQGMIAAFIAGAMSAVMAGACVAPVLLAVLLLTSSYVSAGAYWALCLPFVLGLGMALPWPFAGAGLSFLPRPGAWMVWVKKIFGVIVVLFALYYGFTAWKILSPVDAEAEEHAGVIHVDGAAPQQLADVIRLSLQQGKPVFLDFWGTACKTCKQMDATTLQDEDVKAELAKMSFVKVRIDLANKDIKTVREAYNVQGLPTYIVIDAPVK